MRWIRSDFKAANFLHSRLVVVQLDGHVDALHDPVCHICGPARLYYAITKFGFSDPRHRNIEIDDFRCQPTMLNGRDRAVARDSQVAAYEFADNISIDPIVVMSAWLHDGIARLSQWPVQHVPIRQHVGRTAVCIKNDAPCRPCRYSWVTNANAGNDWINSRLSLRSSSEFRFNLYFPRAYLEIALENIGWNFNTVNREGLREFRRPNAFQGLGCDLTPDRKLDTQLLVGLPSFTL